MDALILQLSNGRRFIVPREDLEGLEKATPTQLAEIRIHAGLGLVWPQLDVDHYLPYLLETNQEYATLMKEIERETVAA